MTAKIKQAIERGKLALKNDSNDEEHDALFELVESLIDEETRDKQDYFPFTPKNWPT